MVAGTPETYGGIRVWGTIGFTATAWLAGLLVNRLGLAWIFYSYAMLLGVAGLLALALPARRQTWGVSFRASLVQLLQQRALALFLTGAFLAGATLQAAYSFYPLHMQSLGGDPAWIGASSALGALTEMPVVFLSGRLLGWVGVRGALMLGYLSFALRWGLLAVLRSPLSVLLTNLLHGLSFGPFLVGGIAFVEAHTPPGLHATAQGLLVAISFGVGAAVGALGGGWLYDTTGPAGLFALSALVMVIAAGFVFAAGQNQDQGVIETP
jgi:PPP family 3-phenylpropionic acid transporter